MARLTQSPEELTAVIKCTRCGLTLDWETEIKVGISRSGKRTTGKVGRDPIEAWNRREMCEVCGHKIHSDQVLALNNCNDCGRENCKYKPQPGQHARINCPVWVPMEATP